MDPVRKIRVGQTVPNPWYLSTYFATSPLFFRSIWYKVPTFDIKSRTERAPSVTPFWGRLLCTWLKRWVICWYVIINWWTPFLRAFRWASLLLYNKETDVPKKFEVIVCGCMAVHVGEMNMIKQKLTRYYMINWLTSFTSLTRTWTQTSSVTDLNKRSVLNCTLASASTCRANHATPSPDRGRVYILHVVCCEKGCIASWSVWSGCLLIQLQPGCLPRLVDPSPVLWWHGVHGLDAMSYQAWSTTSWSVSAVSISRVRSSR